ncbi:hypothetical protein [Pandoraea bronchicola]|uniref:hypothetical protein n=1 Tax=Pandoraea bronchicola TaxID=2508287 RepID=UPI001241D052|nr:hypothetical protein [Pandoraea bronchicola]
MLVTDRLRRFRTFVDLHPLLNNASIVGVNKTLVRLTEIFGLLSFLKVFYKNFVSDADCVRLHGLDVNGPKDVASAIRDLIVPEFYAYSKDAQARLTNLLRKFVADFGQSGWRLVHEQLYVHDGALRRISHAIHGGERSDDRSIRLRQQ